MFDAIDINFILNSLLDDVDLGFISAPALILISATTVLLGIGLRNNWLSFGGIFVIFSYYALLSTGDVTLLDISGIG